MSLQLVLRGLQLLLIRRRYRGCRGWLHLLLWRRLLLLLLVLRGCLLHLLLWRRLLLLLLVLLAAPALSRGLRCRLLRGWRRGLLAVLRLRLLGLVLLLRHRLLPLTSLTLHLLLLRRPLLPPLALLPLVHAQLLASGRGWCAGAARDLRAEAPAVAHHEVSLTSLVSSVLPHGLVHPLLLLLLMLLLVLLLTRRRHLWWQLRRWWIIINALAARR